MGKAVTVSRVTVRSGPRAAPPCSCAGAALAALRPVASASGGGILVLAPRVPVHARYLLIWFTRLPPDGAGTYQATVNGISVTGSPTPG